MKQPVSHMDVKVSKHTHTHTNIWENLEYNHKKIIVMYIIYILVFEMLGHDLWGSNKNTGSCYTPLLVGIYFFMQVNR